MAFIPVLLNVIWGFFSASKKSGERRCLSRSASFVSMLAVWIENSTEEFSGLARSTLIVPLTSSNRPVTRLMRWRIVKMASEWVLSTT